MTRYEQIQTERRQAEAALDRIYQPIDYAVLRVDTASHVRRFGGRCAVRVEQPHVPITPDAVLHAVEAVRQSKDRGS